MFFKVPVETYIEIQKSSKRKTILLIFFLLVIYFIAIYLLFELTLFFIPLIFSKFFSDTQSIDYTLKHIPFVGKVAGVLIVSAISTYIHYKRTINKTIPSLPFLFGATPAIDDDTYHKRFSNIVGELSQATGIYNVRPAVVSSTSTNAFAVSDGENFNFVIITEGLLARLNRQELEAVVAHEFSHILHGDAVLTTIACSLFGIFEQVLETLKRKKVNSGIYQIVGRRYFLFIVYFILIKTICSLTLFFSRIFMIFISRQRETLADATAVKLTRNPLALAEGLYKISRKWRYGGFVAKGFSPLFIMNPNQLSIDEEENLFADFFSTHPPLKVRLKMLLGLAKASLQKSKKSEYTIVEKKERWWVSSEGKMLGPYTMPQLTAVAGVLPLAWVCRDGTSELKRLKDEPELNGVFIPRDAGNASNYLCPRCNKTLVKRKYEGTDVFFCIYCKGHLVKHKNFIKILVRHDEPISRNMIRELNKMQRENLKKKKPSLIDGFPESMCPACRKAMQKVFHSYSTFIVIDRCNICKLIWFDEKELEYINSLVAYKDVMAAEQIGETG
ncbi:MAG: M48 family metalloprotease [Elusimicrobia bacterium]|nr:M48 family metalloprotease [Elusimicrobiota bacterium]